MFWMECPVCTVRDRKPACSRTKQNKTGIRCKRIPVHKKAANGNRTRLLSLGS